MGSVATRPLYNVHRPAVKPYFPLAPEPVVVQSMRATWEEVPRAIPRVDGRSGQEDRAERDPPPLLSQQHDPQSLRGGPRDPAGLPCAAARGSDRRDGRARAGVSATGSGGEESGSCRSVVGGGHPSPPLSPPPLQRRQRRASRSHRAGLPAP